VAGAPAVLKGLEFTKVLSAIGTPLLGMFGQRPSMAAQG
jgi:hypothetical protein